MKIRLTWGIATIAACVWISGPAFGQISEKRTPIQAAGAGISAYPANASVQAQQTSRDENLDLPMMEKKVKEEMPLAGNALWARYMTAGDQFKAKKDMASAKRYYMAALTEIEKLPNRTSLGPTVAIVESKLMAMYPNNWDKSTLSEADKLKVQQEQAGVLYRIAQLNRTLGDGGNNILSIYTEKKYRKSLTDLQKTQSAIQDKAPKTVSHSGNIQ